MFFKLVALQLSRGVQNEIKFINKIKETDLPLHAIISMQNEPNPFLCRSSVLGKKKKKTCCMFSFEFILLSVWHRKNMKCCAYAERPCNVQIQIKIQK